MQMYLLKWLPSLALLLGLISQCQFILRDPDSIELWLTLQQGGIAHPPGYSIYLSINKALISCIPFGKQSQLTILLLFQITLLTASLELLKTKFNWSPLAIWFGVASLLIFKPFVYAATNLEVYALQVFLACLAISLYDKPEKSYIFYFVIGVLIVHHSSSLFFCIILILYVCRTQGLKYLRSLPIALIPVIYNFVYLYWFGTQVKLRNQWYELGNLSDLIDFASASNYAQVYLTWPNSEQLYRLFDSVIYSSTPIFGLILLGVFVLGITKQKCFLLFALCISQCMLLPFYAINDLWTYLALPSVLAIAFLSQIFDNLSANLKKTFLLSAWILYFVSPRHDFPKYSQFDKSRISQAIQISKQGVPSLFIAKDNILLVQLHQSQLAAIALHRLMHPKHLQWLEKQVPTINWPKWNLDLHNLPDDESRFFSIFSNIKALNPQLRIYLDSEEFQLNQAKLRSLNNGVWNQFIPDYTTPIMWMIAANPTQNYVETQVFKINDTIALRWQTDKPDLCFSISLVPSKPNLTSKVCAKGKQGSKIIKTTDLPAGKYRIQFKDREQLASELHFQLVEPKESQY